MEKKKKEEVPKTRWGVLILVLGIILVISFFFISLMVSFFSSGGQPSSFGKGNVAVIHIDGEIVTEGGSIFSPSTASSLEIIQFIQQASKDDSIQAILFEINSPGGSAVASDEVVAAMKQVKKPTVSYIREVGASGAYWIASSTDHIFASRMSITGSVGVISSYLAFGGFLNRYNITYERLVAGKYKDIGTPFRTLTDEEQNILQQQLDDVHAMFLSDVKENRHLSQAQVNEISTGIFFIGARAKELGLIDEIGGKDEAVAYLERQINTSVELVEYKRESSLVDILTGVLSKASFQVGEGIGHSLKEEQPITLYT